MNFDFVPSGGTPGIKFVVTARRVTILLGIIVLIISILALVGLVFRFYLAEPLGVDLGNRADPGSLHSLLFLFNADDEFSIANWYATIALMFVAMLLTAVGLIKRSNMLAYRWYWIGLGIIFVVLSVGDAAVLNDRLVRPSQNLFHPTGFFYFGWVIPALFLVFVFVLLYLRFFLDLPPRIRRLFFIAAALYVGGALGLEMVASNYSQNLGQETFIFSLMSLVEETMEMVGVLTLIYAVLSYIESPALRDDSRLRWYERRIRLSERARLIVVLLGLFALLLNGAAARHMRADEGIAMDGTGGTIARTITYQAEDVHAPVYFVTLHLWRKLMGDSELMARTLSLLLDMLTLSLVFRMGRRWFGRWAAWGAVLALGLSSYFYLYGLEVRPYALAMLVGTVSMWRFDRWLSRPTWRHAAYYGLTVVAMLYLHYFLAFLILAQGLYFLLGARRDRDQWVQAVGALGGAFVLWLPWFPVFLAQVRHVGAMVDDTMISGLGMPATTLPTNPEIIGRFLRLAFNNVPLILAVVLVGGAVALWRQRRYGLVLTWGVGVPVLAFAINVIVPVYEPRYVSYLVPGLALLIGVSVVGLARKWKPLALVALAAVGVLTANSGVVHRRPERDYLAAVNEAFMPGDIVYVEAGIGFDPLNRYLFPQYAPEIMGHIYGSEPQEGYVQPITDDEFPRCIWFATRRFHDDAVQAHFRALEADRPVLKVIGQHVALVFQRMCLPPEVEPVSFENGMRFLGADLTRSAGQLTLDMWWDVQETLAQNYSIGVYLLDSSGALVAQQDGPITDYWGRGVLETSVLETGTVYIDHRVMTLPPGLSGEYTLAMAVYWSEDGTRLQWENGAGDLLTLQTISFDD